MGAKYICNYSDYFDQKCRIEIEPSIGWNADPIIVKGVSKNACKISYDADDDLYENPIINSKASINILQEGQINILEIQESNDRDFIVSVFINNSLTWKGFLIPDGVQQFFESAPYELNLTATDGLMLLDGIDYSHDNLEGGRCIINYFRRILFSKSNLGIELPIRWVSSLKNEAYPLEEDALSGSIKWSPRGEGFSEPYFDNNGNIAYKYKSCLYIITEMAKSIQSVIFQDEGIWKLIRLNDCFSGTYIYREIQGLSGFLINTSTVIDVKKTIAGKSKNKNYSFIEKDHILTVVPALKKVSTKYEHEKRQNILPNGNMDIVDVYYGKPLYWNANNLSVSSIPSLSESRGSAVEVSNPTSGNGYLRNGRQPTSIIQAPGVRFMITFYFKGITKTGDKIVLTERNYRTGEDISTITYIVPSAFNDNTLGALQNFASVFPNKPSNPVVSYDASSQEYIFRYIGFSQDIAGSQTITTVSQNSFTHDGFLPIDTDVLYSTINLGFKFSIVSGFALNENGVIDWNNTPNQIRVTYRRGSTVFYLNENGFWVNTVTDIQISVGQLKPGDIAQVDFNSKQDIKMPLPDVVPIDRTNTPEIKIEFLIPSGRKILFDDVYFSVPDNYNISEGNILGNTNTKKQEYVLKISSAHSGFYVSNYMTDYTQSGVEKFWSDSKFGGTLTDINTHAILRNKYKSSIQFEGTIYGKNYSYGEIYNIDTLNDKNFLPLKSEWNTETNSIKLSCIEVRDDNINIELEQYGSESDGIE